MWAPRIFAPAGMTRSGFPVKDGSDPSVAIGYTRGSALGGHTGAGGPMKSNLGMLPIRGCPAGSSTHTAEDLLRLDRALRAGKLLDKILEAIKFTREDIYILNMVKCRPPENRDPSPEEMEACSPYLIEQLRLIKPKLICLLGRVAAQRLLDTKTPLGKLRGTFHDFMGAEVLVTYHPAALLRFQSYKRDTWEDMQKLKARFDEVTK